MGELKLTDDEYLVRLVTLASRKRDFTIAEQFLLDVKDQSQLNNARLMIAAYRQSDEDRQLLNTELPGVVENFRRQLAKVQDKNQLMWLHSKSLRMEEIQFAILGAEIHREIALRANTPERKDIIWNLRRAHRSAEQFRQQSLERQAEIFGVSIDGFSVPLQRVDELLRQLPATDQSRRQRLLDEMVKQCNELAPLERDHLIGQIAVALAKLGDEKSVLDSLQQIENRKLKCFALLNCAMIFPPRTSPLLRDSKYRSRIVRGGFEPGGIF